MAEMGSGAFSASIKSFIGKAAAANDNACRKTYIDLGSRLIEGQPKDTGKTASQWLPSVGAPDPGKNESTDYEAAKRAVETVATFWDPKKEDAFLANNSVVAVVHEYGLYPNPPKHGTGKTIDGFSTQAPQGVVGVAIAEMKGEA